MSKNNPGKKEAQELRAKIEKALGLAMRYGRIKEGQDKQWVIDQMVRTLTGCPTVQYVGFDAQGRRHAHDGLGESEEYKGLVRKATEGEDGPASYWSTGIAPHR